MTPEAAITPDVLTRIRARRRAGTVLRAGSFDPAGAVDRVVLDASERCRRRIVLTGEGGLRLLVDLAAATVVGDGDGLLLDDGGVVAVVARLEPLVEITAPAGGRTPSLALARLAWHLGNRHVEVEIGDGRLRMRRDHVLEAMLESLGAVLTPLEAPFEPERGAFGHGHGAGGRGEAE